MSIKFHCDYCGKKIEAQDSAGGKWAKCPACHNKIYVPAPDTGEELKLSPVDEAEEAREQQLMNETYLLTQDILQERETPRGLTEGVIMDVNEKELTKNIILYLRQIADGELEEAEQALTFITPFGRQAEKIIDQLAISEIPEPELADIPQQVLAGLIRDLRSKIR
jgi:DNA-directed RNA polymerase subunit RPC12/RpoP